MANSLDFLKAAGTTISSDTGAFLEIPPFGARDATTNPSLVYAAVVQPEYTSLVDLAVEYAAKRGVTLQDRTAIAMDRLLIEVGIRILRIIPGQVSVSLDPRLGFDKEAMVKKGIRLANIMKEFGIPSTRYLIKIPATWEGIQAARVLQDEHHLRTNMTLVFGLVQAQACAEAGVAIISPFVGRIMDWHLKESGRSSYDISEHPGVQMVQKAKRLFHTRGYKTKIMAAGFRTTDEIAALAGLDIMTLPPSLLSLLQGSTRPIPRAISVDFELNEKDMHTGTTTLFNDEALYRQALARERIAVEKVAEGLSKFSADTDLLEAKVRASVQALPIRMSA